MTLEQIAAEAAALGEDGAGAWRLDEGEDASTALASLAIKTSEQRSDGLEAVFSQTGRIFSAHVLDPRKVRASVDC
jgi:hypothetical protein